MKKLFLLALMIATSCSNDNSVNPGPGGPSGPPLNQNWLIPVNQVFDVVGRDGIPALSEPLLIDASQAEYMFDPELVIGYYDGRLAVAYPHHILDWHEIINHTVGGFSMAITYCPLTGTGIGWPQDLDNLETEFGVSGLLYNNNLIAFDRNTRSNWSQMSLTAVNGPLIGTEISTFPLVETRWSTWKTMFPDTKVVSRETGWDRPYGNYPYNDFRSNHDNLFFPLTFDDRRLERKERVHGVLINGKAKTYRFDSFGADNTLIMDTFQGTDLVIVGNRNSSFIVSFAATLSDGTQPAFSAIDEGKDILSDDQGNKWDIFGNHVAGPASLNLNPTQSFMGYWFAWGAFYAETEIFDF